MIDTETTGLGAARGRPDGVVEVAVAYRDGAGELCTWSRTCNPGDAYLENGRADHALRISGISPSVVRSSPSAADIASELRTLLDEVRVGKEVKLHAYNAAFDRSFLEPAPWMLNYGWGDCIMLAAHAAIDPRARWPKLVDACAHLNIPYPGVAHRAEHDAHAALLIWEELSARRVLQPTGPQERTARH